MYVQNASREKSGGGLEARPWEVGRAEAGTSTAAESESAAKTPFLSRMRHRLHYMTPAPNINPRDHQSRRMSECLRRQIPGRLERRNPNPAAHPNLETINRNPDRQRVPNLRHD